MVPVTPRFPLFKLPYLAWNNVLRIMTPLDIIITALCSQRAKRSILSLFPKPCTMGMILDITMIFDQFNIDIGNNRLNMAVRNSKFIFESPTPTIMGAHPYEYLPGDLDGKGWVRHLMEVLNCNGMEFTFYSSSYNLEHLERFTEGQKIHGLQFKCRLPNPYLEEVLKKFKPTKRLSLVQRPKSLSPDVLTRKYDSIDLQFESSIDDILLLNAKSISLLSMSAFDFNTLMKRWVKGWNQEVTSLSVSIDTTNGDFRLASLNGLDCEQLTGSYENYEGCKVTNCYGKKASIIFCPKKFTRVPQNYLNRTQVYFGNQ